MTSPRSQDYHPIRVELPSSLHTNAAASAQPIQASVPNNGSAVMSASESDTEGEGRYGSMEDASVLYSKPQKRHAARTLSFVRRDLLSLVDGLRS